MKRANRKPFRLGIGSIYNVAAKINTIGSLTLICMLGGLWMMALSHEQFSLGLQHDPVGKILPGGEDDADEIYRDDRYLLKGVDDGAVWHRALPIPTAHWLAGRVDNVTVMGLHGLTAPATRDYVVSWLDKEYPDQNPYEVYERVYDGGVTGWITSWKIDEGNLWRQDVALQNGARFLIWVAFGCAQSFILRGASREFLGGKFDETNKLTRKVASKDSVYAAEGYAFAYNVIDLVVICLLLAVVIGSYYVEFALTASLSPKLSPRWMFRLMSIFGFEASFAIVSRLTGSDKKSLPTKSTTKPPTKPAGKSQPKQTPGKSNPKDKTTKGASDAHRSNKPSWMPNSKTNNKPPAKEK